MQGNNSQKTEFWYYFYEHEKANLKIKKSAKLRGPLGQYFIKQKKDFLCVPNAEANYSLIGEHVILVLNTANLKM